jgi:hypothetical protein
VTHVQKITWGIKGVLWFASAILSILMAIQILKELGILK